MGLALRIVLGLLLAAGGILGLAHTVADDPGPAAPPATTPDPPITLPEGVRGPARRVVLVSSSEDVPDDAAPVLALGEEGRVRLLRPPPLARSPRPGPWPRAALVLPRDHLAGLGPRQRAAFLELCAGFGGGRALPADRIEARGVAWGNGALEGLLRWQR